MGKQAFEWMCRYMRSSGVHDHERRAAVLRNSLPRFHKQPLASKLTEDFVRRMVLEKGAKARWSQHNCLASLNKTMKVQSQTNQQTYCSQTHERTCNLTIRSNASVLDISAETCFATCSHQEGDEKRCRMQTLHRSNSTGGTTVGSSSKRESASVN